MSIGGKINNADKLFGHFRDQLHADLDAKYPGGKGMPAALKEFYAQPKSQDALTKLLGFQDEKGMSAMMHDGDTLTFQNGALVFKPLHGEAHMLIDQNGKVSPLDLSKVKTTAFFHQETPAVAEIKNTVPDASDFTEAPASVPVQPPAAPVLPTETVAPIAPASAPVPPSAPVESADTVAAATAPKPSIANTNDGISALGSEDGIRSSVSAPVSAPISSLDTVRVPSGSSINDGITALDAPIASSTSFEVNPEIPSGYEWRVPGTLARQPYAFGGTEKASSALAHDYAARNPGSTMYFTHIKHRLFGGSTVEVSAWTSDAKGAVKKIAKVLDRTGKPLRPPVPTEFVAPVTK
jgi:hypothetical protein